MTKKTPDNKTGVIIGFVLAVIAFILIVLAIFDKGPHTLNVMLVVFGGLLGWTVGILLSSDHSQAAKFSKYGSAILTLLTGFLVAKLDRIFELKVEENANFIDDLFILRSLLLGGSFLLGVLCTFIWRTYVSGNNGSNDQNKEEKQDQNGD